MALKITRNLNTFKVEGQLNANTASYFKTHFTLTLNCINELIIDIDKVNEIDSDGVRAIHSVYNQANSWKKPFAIIGNGCKEIYQDFNCSQVA